MSDVKVPEAQSRLSGLHVCFDSFGVCYLGEYFRKHMLAPEEQWSMGSVYQGGQARQTSPW